MEYPGLGAAMLTSLFVQIGGCPCTVRARRPCSGRGRGPGAAMPWSGPSRSHDRRITAEDLCCRGRPALKPLELIVFERQRRAAHSKSVSVLPCQSRRPYPPATSITLRQRSLISRSYPTYGCRPAVVATWALDRVAAERLLVATDAARQRYFM